MRPFAHRFAACAAAAALWAAPAAAATLGELAASLGRFLKIGAAPKVKGPGDEVRQGSVWVASLSSGAAQNLAPGQGGYRSPIFFPGGAEVLALRGGDLYRLSLAGKDPERLGPAGGAQRLVAFDPSDPDKVLVLVAEKAAPALLSLSTGKVTPLPEPQTDEDRKALEYVRGWYRDDGTAKLDVEVREKDVTGGKVSCADVLVVREGRETNVTNCTGPSCGQPALSPDGRLVAYVQGED